MKATDAQVIRELYLRYSRAADYAHTGESGEQLTQRVADACGFSPATVRAALEKRGRGGRPKRRICEACGQPIPHTKER